MKANRMYKLASALMLIVMLMGTIAGCAPAAPPAAPARRRAADGDPRHDPGRAGAPTAAPAARLHGNRRYQSAGGHQAPRLRRAAVKEGGKVTIAMWSPPNNFNAINTDSSYGFFNVGMLFDTLVTFDEKVNFVPRLAEKWEVSADKTTFTFHINPKAKWHDGTPVTAADVEFTIWAITHPKIETNRGHNVSMLKGLKGSKRAEGVDKVEGVKVVDDRTIQLTTPTRLIPSSCWSWSAWASTSSRSTS